MVKRSRSRSRKRCVYPRCAVYRRGSKRLCRRPNPYIIFYRHRSQVARKSKHALKRTAFLRAYKVWSKRRSGHKKLFSYRPKSTRRLCAWSRSHKRRH